MDVHLRGAVGLTRGRMPTTSPLMGVSVTVPALTVPSMPRYPAVFTVSVVVDGRTRPPIVTRAPPALIVNEPVGTTKSMSSAFEAVIETCPVVGSMVTPSVSVGSS